MWRDLCLPIAVTRVSRGIPASRNAWSLYRRAVIEDAKAARLIGGRKGVCGE